MGDKGVSLLLLLHYLASTYAMDPQSTAAAISSRIAHVLINSMQVSIFAGSRAVIQGSVGITHAIFSGAVQSMYMYQGVSRSHRGR